MRFKNYCLETEGGIEFLHTAIFPRTENEKYFKINSLSSIDFQDLMNLMKYTVYSHIKYTQVHQEALAIFGP